MRLTCRCGRTMALDGAKPAWHYRCGCGWQVRITPAPVGQCVAIRSSGRLCGRKADVTTPVELCMRHLEKLLRSEHPLLDRALRNVVTIRDAKRQQAAAEEEQRNQVRKAEQLEHDEARQRSLIEQSVVYYVKIGQYIKIGTSVNLKQRLASLPVDAVLATEPGDEELESARHREFADLRAIRHEYFWPGDRLLDHIEAVRRKHGDAVITTYPDLA